MKKLFLYLVTAVFILFTFSACNNDNPPDEVTETTTAPEELTTEQTTPPVAQELTSTTSSSEETTVPDEDPDDLGMKIAQTAEALIGVPFAENSASPTDGFDNSGFIYYVLRENGFVNCPRLTPDQAAMGTHIDYDELKIGDLAFFCTADSGNPDFGGIYIGNGQLVYSPMPGQDVRIADITSDYWKSTFVTGISIT